MGKASKQVFKVFKFDGTQQCGLGQEIPIHIMEAELVALGVSVESSGKENYPGMIIQVCGAPTGKCNVFDVGADDWPLRAKSILGAGFHPWPNNDNTVEPVFANARMSVGGGDAWPWSSHGTSSTKGGIGFPVRSLPSDPKLSELTGGMLRIYKTGDIILPTYFANRVSIELDPVTGGIVAAYVG